MSRPTLRHLGAMYLDVGKWVIELAAERLRPARPDLYALRQAVDVAEYEHRVAQFEAARARRRNRRAAELNVLDCDNALTAARAALANATRR